ncbi:MAG TPA: hypothetical protein VNA21_07720 [Steroidobacteraceae bacterium]|nr:hypothetical protein [Steroidobacteraceae bacterium]
MAALIAVTGFWPTYFGPLLAGTLETLPVIHIHAAVFVGWLLLVIAQAALAATGRRALHVKLGSFGIIYGVFLIFVGLATAFVHFAVRIEAGNIEQARNQLFVPLTDLMVFTPFLFAAWLYRRNPEVHKRLIIVATTVLLIAAVHRMTFILGARPIPPARVLLVWLAPIYLGMIHDLVKQRRVHPVYVIGIAAIIYMKFYRVPLFESQAWKSFAAWLTTFYV